MNKSFPLSLCQTVLKTGARWRIMQLVTSENGGYMRFIDSVLIITFHSPYLDCLILVVSLSFPVQEEKRGEGGEGSKGEVS